MNEWKKTIYLLIIFFIILVGWYFLYHYIFDNKMTEVNDSIAIEEESIALKIEQINKALEQEEDLAKTNYYVYIPKESGIPNILDFFSKTAQKNKVNIEHIEVDNQVADSTEVTSVSELTTLSIRMFLNGDYVNIRTFLNDVYSGERLLNLTKWQWENNGDSEINIYLSYEAYYYPNNFEQFKDLPVIQTYSPAYRVNPLLKTIVKETVVE